MKRFCIVCASFGLLAPAPAARLDGRVVDAWTRLPVPYADIDVLTTDAHLAADSAGRFTTVLPGDSATLVVSRVGYYATEWRGRFAAREVVLALRPKVLSIDGVTVSASRTPLPLDRAGAVRVYGRDELRTGGRLDPSDAVRSGAGAAVRDYANYSSVGLRGANAEHTLVALDGVRQNSSQSGTFDLSTIALALADRVEVARGAASAVFGSGPVGGVVNVVTPEPDSLAAQVSADVGSFGRRRLDFRHTNWVAPIGYLVAGELYSARNDFAFIDSSDSLRRLGNADTEREAVLAKGRFQSGPHQANLLGELSTTRRGVPGTTLYPSDSARRDDYRGQVIARYTAQPTGRLRTSLKAHAARNWQNYRDPQWGTNDTHRLSTGGAAAEVFWQTTSNIGVLGAVEYSGERLASTAVGSPSRGVLAGTFQFRVQVHGFDVTHMLRYDRITSRAVLADSIVRRSTLAALSPKVMATYTGLRPLEMFSAVSRAFRAPSFNDLYWPEDAFTYGNPRLRPETGASYELGLAAQPARGVRASVNGFYSHLTDLIQWQPDSAFRFHPVNVQDASIVGVELDGRVEIGPAELRLSATWNRARADSLALIYRPTLAGAARVGHRLPVAALAPRAWLAADYTGPRFADPANTDTLEGYLLLDAGLELSPRVGPLLLEFEVGLRNLLDACYETTRGYPTPGRSAYAELSLGI